MVTSWLSSSGGGVSAVVEALSRSISEQGHDVRVIGLEDQDWLDMGQHDWSGADAIACKVVGPKTLGYSPSMTSSIEDWEPDLVHLHGIWQHPSRSVRQWGKRTNRPYVISPHGMLEPTALNFSARKKALVSLLYQDECFAKAWGLLATSEKERQDFRNYGLTHKAGVIPNGIEIESISETGSSLRNRKFILSLGRVHPIKGFDRLIAAWAKLEHDFPDWDVVIAGPDEAGHRSELSTQIQNLGLKRLQIHDPVYGSNRSHLMASAELFALPSLSENFALTVAESLVQETPVVSTYAAPWEGLMDNRCGWWIDHGTDLLANTLREAMLLSDAERSAMGRRGRQWMMRDFTWTSVADQTIRFYEGIMAEAPFKQIRAT